MDKNNFFLGSVGRVEAFRMEGGQPQLAFVSKTMTDQGLNTSISADDIRAGQGAPIVARFYHDANVEITLTDVMFKEAYVEAQLDTDFSEYGASAYVSKEVKASNNTLDLGEVPMSIGFGCEKDAIVVWFAKKGTNNWILAQGTPGSTTITDTTNIEDDAKYCVRYLREAVAGAKKAEIYANFVPGELHLIITVPLYAGDGCSASNGSIAGEVQFDIPRFRPNGGQDFAAAMSSNQTTNLSGVALGFDSDCTGGRGALLYTMTVIYNGEKLADQYESLEVLDSCLHLHSMPIVYGIDANKRATLISNGLLNFLPNLSNNGFSEQGSTTISAKDGSGLSVIVTVGGEA